MSRSDKAKIFLDAVLIVCLLGIGAVGGKVLFMQTCPELVELPAIADDCSYYRAEPPPCPVKMLPISACMNGEVSYSCMNIGVH